MISVYGANCDKEFVPFLMEWDEEQFPTVQVAIINMTSIIDLTSIIDIAVFLSGVSLRYM